MLSPSEVTLYRQIYLRSEVLLVQHFWISKLQINNILISLNVHYYFEYKHVIQLKNVLPNYIYYNNINVLLQLVITWSHKLKFQYSVVHKSKPNESAYTVHLNNANITNLNYF